MYGLRSSRLRTRKIPKLHAPEFLHDIGWFVIDLLERPAEVKGGNPTREWSVIGLIIFAVLFALIGGYAIALDLFN